MSAVGRLKAELAGYDDDAVLASIESETNALELMDQILDHVLADEALVNAGKARLKRIEARADRRRVILSAMMEQIGEKLERPLATLSLSYPRNPMVTNADELPKEYIRESADMIAIGKALRAGQKIPGAELRNPQAQLTIRTS